MVRRFIAAGGVLLAAALLLPTLPAATGEQQAKKAALAFGSSLKHSDTAALRSVLPSRGKVNLRLIVFGPEEGSYSADQVQVLFKGFLRQGEVRSFDLLHVQCSTDQFALVHARAGVTDRDGRAGEVDLHLTFQPENDRWVLREIREAR